MHYGYRSEILAPDGVEKYRLTAILNFCARLDFAINNLQIRILSYLAYNITTDTVLELSEC